MISEFYFLYPCYVNCYFFLLETFLMHRNASLNWPESGEVLTQFSENSIGFLLSIKNDDSSELSHNITFKYLVAINKNLLGFTVVVMNAKFESFGLIWIKVSKLGIETENEVHRCNFIFSATKPDNMVIEKSDSWARKESQMTWRAEIRLYLLRSWRGIILSTWLGLRWSI